MIFGFIKPKLPHGKRSDDLFRKMPCRKKRESREDDICPD